MPVPLQPGSTPIFTVTPTFSGAPFTTVAAKASVTSSDPVNFPVKLVPSDVTGLTFEATIPATLTAEENVTVVWLYHNTDGTTATVTGSITLLPAATDDLNGGTFAQTT